MPRVGPYRLESQLGQGGMGSVWVGVHTTTGVRHALKLLDAGDDPELRARLLREAEALGRLGAHPNLVSVHASGVEGGRPWIAMELVTGGDLAGRLRTGPLAPAAVVALGGALAAGLAHAHARGVLHRDLKPSNVVFGEDGAPRLVDFGVARVAGAAALTRTGGALGTPGYSAPEQLGGAEVDARADVYGLGAVLYHALAGQPAFVALTPIAAVASALQGPAPPSSVAPALRHDPLARELEAIVLRALAFDPGARFPSAAALGQALSEVGRGLPAPRAARGPRVLVGVGAGAVAVVALVAAGSALVVATPAGPGEVAAPTTRSGGAPAVDVPAPPGVGDGPAVAALLDGKVEPEEVLARVALAWGDPSARPAHVRELGAALLLAEPPPPPRSWETGGLTPEEAAWLTSCAGEGPGPRTDPAKRSIVEARAAATELRRVAGQLVTAPLDRVAAVEGLVRAAEEATGADLTRRLLRVAAQRRLLLLQAEPLVQLMGASESKKAHLVEVVDALLLRAEALEPGRFAAGLRLLRRWGLWAHKDGELPAGIRRPPLDPELVLPPRLVRLELAHAALLLIGPPPTDRAQLAALRRRTAEVLGRARRVGGVGAAGSLGKLVEELLDQDAFLASWDVWLGRGEPDAEARFAAAKAAALLVEDSVDQARHLARLCLMRGDPAGAREALGPEPGRPTDWRAAYFLEVALLEGELARARLLLHDAPRPVAAAQAVAIVCQEAQEARSSPEELRRLAGELDEGQVAWHLPWRGTEATRAMVEAVIGGWRREAGAPPWPGK